MAEKWDDTNDSPEVVYEGFSPTSTHPQEMINAASSSFVSADCNNDGTLGAQPGGYMPTASMPEEQQHQIHGQGSHHEEPERTRLCFVCCNPVSENSFESIKTSMNHSHAPLLVLLTDVLGYKLEEGRLHSQVVCKTCYHLLDIIDELQQTLTESKTDVRTKFLETVQKLKLKYPRTDKMLKPRCLRCIQMSQTSARKRGRGRGWKSRSEDIIRGKGRGRGRGRARSRSEDGNDPTSDNDSEGQGYCSEDIRNGALPSKSHLPQTDQDNSKPDVFPLLELSGAQSKSSLVSEHTEHCLWYKATGNQQMDTLNIKQLRKKNYWSFGKEKSCNSSEMPLDSWIDNGSNMISKDIRIQEHVKYCEDCEDMQYYNCSLCNCGDSEFFYQYCDACLMCQGVFIPWGNNVTASFVGNPCSIWKVQARTYVIEERRSVISFGLVDKEIALEKILKETDTETGILSKILPKDGPLDRHETDFNISVSCMRDGPVADYDDFNVKEELDNIRHDTKLEKRNECGGKSSQSDLVSGSPVAISESKCVEFLMENNLCPNKSSSLAEAENSAHKCNGTESAGTKNNSVSCDLISKINSDVMVTGNKNDIGLERVTCIMDNVDERSVVDHSYIEVTEPLNVDVEITKKLGKDSGIICELSSSCIEKCLPEDKDLEPGVELISDIMTISSQLNLEEENQKHAGKVKELTQESVNCHAMAVLVQPGSSGIYPDEGSKKHTSPLQNNSPVEVAKGQTKKDYPPCGVCGKKLDALEDINSESIVNISEVSLHTCSSCSSRAIEKTKHENCTDFHTQEKEYKCDTCEKEFSSHISYTRHRKMHNIKKSAKASHVKKFMGSDTVRQQMDMNVEAGNFVCEVCGGRFTLQEEFKLHQKLHSVNICVEGSSGCDIESVTCIKEDFEESPNVEQSYIEVTDTFSDDSDKEKVVSDTTRKVKPQPADDKNGKKALSDIFTDISSQPCLGKRRRKPTPKVKEFVEEELNYGVEKRNKNHHNEDSCKGQVRQDETTSQELSDKGKGRDYRYICEFCGKKFNSIGGFRYHVDGHKASAAKLFTCNLCSYKTRRKADLRKHNVIHTGEKKYKCEICGQEFSVNSSYTRHMRIHSGEKPYKCTICGKDFRSGATLKQHMVRHTGARNFVCEVCGSSFSLRHHYTAHWKLHSGDMPFKCKVCTVTFRNYSALLHHRKKNHPKEESQKLKDLKMKFIQVEELKVKERNKVLEHSVDVLQQAMEAAVDSVTECVDSYTQTIPVDAEICDGLVSKVTACDLPDKSSIILATKKVEEALIPVIPKEGTGSKYPKDSQELSDDPLHETPAGIISTVEISDDIPLTLKEDESHTSVHHVIGKSLESPFYCEEGVLNTGNFVVVDSEGQPVPNLKPEHVKVVHSENDDTSPMYIVLSDIQAQDSQLYIVLDKETHSSN